MQISEEKEPVPTAKGMRNRLQAMAAGHFSAGGGKGKDDIETPPLPFESLRNEPPMRLGVPLPTTRPIAVITASGGLRAVVKPNYKTSNTVLGSPRDGQAPHHIRRDFRFSAEEAPVMPTFASNARSSVAPTTTQSTLATSARGESPSAILFPVAAAAVSKEGYGPGSPGRALKGSPSRTFLTQSTFVAVDEEKRTVSSRSEQGWRNRGTGWVEPHPTNLRRLGQNATLLDFNPLLLQRIFQYLPPHDLTESTVFVCRAWGYAIESDSILRRRRRLFTFSGKDYDGRGILQYLAQHTTCLSKLCRDGNPSLGPAPAVLIACSSLDGDVAPDASNISKFPNLHKITQFGISHFQTPGMPYAWVGVDFQDFRVVPTHYTIGTSTNFDQIGLPLEWELHGCVSDHRDVTSTRKPKGWGDCLWVVLHRYCSSSGSTPFDTKSSKGQRSMTFTVPPSALRGRGAMKKLRIVQTARNTLWGTELTISGLEFYGQLFHRGAEPSQFQYY